MPDAIPDTCLSCLMQPCDAVLMTENKQKEDEIVRVASAEPHLHHTNHLLRYFYDECPVKWR